MYISILCPSCLCLVPCLVPVLFLSYPCLVPVLSLSCSCLAPILSPYCPCPLPVTPSPPPPETQSSTLKPCVLFYVLFICIVIAGVSSPHECLIMPELYLHYSSVFLYGNKSLRFKEFSGNIIHNEIKSNQKKTQKKTKNP